MMNVPTAVAIVEEIAGKEDGLDQIGFVFRGKVGEPHNPIVRAINWMLGYRFIEAAETSARKRYGAAFAPSLEMKDRHFPPCVDQIPDRENVIAIWTEFAGLIKHPMVKSRVSDLLWCTDSGGDRHQHARRAIDAYIAVADLADADPADKKRLMGATLGICRALELSLTINDLELVRLVRDRIAQMLREEMWAEHVDSRPGVWMRLAQALVSLDADERPPGLNELLQDGHALLGDRAKLRLALFQMSERLARGDQDSTRRIRRSSVAMLISHARRQVDGLARQHWFIEAHELARAKSLGARTENRIRRALQRIDPSTTEWQESSIPIEIPHDEVEQWIDSIVGSDGIAGALHRFATAGGNPIADREETEKLVDELAQKFVFRDLSTLTVVDDHGRRLRSAANPEEKRNLDILSQEASCIQFDGLFRQLALDRIGERHPINRETLAVALQAGFIDEQKADRFARAFEHYWADRPDDALLVSLPMIENVFRACLDAVGGVIYQPPRGQLPGRLSGLGEILRKLEKRHPDDKAAWFRYFRIVLTEPSPGLNLRNRYLHGIAGRPTKLEAAIVLRIVALLRFASVARRP